MVVVLAMAVVGLRTSKYEGVGNSGVGCKGVGIKGICDG